MHVVKMHGARNDFVLVDARRERVGDAAALARRLCDRRAGIGADGLLVVESSDVVAARMRIVNADGSEAEMCGNGIRCFARFLDENGEGDAFSIETLSGVFHTRVVQRRPEYLVRVALGPPDFEQTLGGGSLDRLGMTRNRLGMTVVRVGNPHAVLLCDDAGGVDLAAVADGLRAEFPDGINVHAASVESEHRVRAFHHERGVGPTQACGTGAVACVVLAIARGLAKSPVEAIVPGGTLTVEWDGARALALVGPAERVFDGAIEP